MDTVVKKSKIIDRKYHERIEIKSSSESKAQAFLSLIIKFNASRTHAESYIIQATTDQPEYSARFDPLLYQEIKKIGPADPNVLVGERMGVKWGRAFFFHTTHYGDVYKLLRLLQGRLPGVSQSAIESLFHQVYHTLSEKMLLSHVERGHIDEAIEAAKYQSKTLKNESSIWLLAMQLETSGLTEYAKKAYLSIENTHPCYQNAQFRIARLNDAEIIERFTSLIHSDEQAIAVLDKSFIANVVAIMPEEQLNDLILSPMTEVSLKIHLAQLLSECGHVSLTRSLYDGIIRQSRNEVLLGQIHYKMAVLLKEFFPAESFLFYQHCLHSNRYVPNESVITLLKERMDKEASKENIADFIADCLRLSLAFEESLYHAGTVLIECKYPLLAYGFFELIKPCKAKAEETSSLFENARYAMATLMPAAGYNIKLTQIIGTVLGLCINSGAARIYSSVSANYEVLTGNVVGMNKALFSLHRHGTPLVTNSFWNRGADGDRSSVRDALQPAFLSRPTVI